LVEHIGHRTDDHRQRRRRPPLLPKPDVIIDDQALTDWRRLVEVHPMTASTYRPEDYQRLT